jgi:suppressor for copper-sensitivity B
MSLSRPIRALFAALLAGGFLATAPAAAQLPRIEKASLELRADRTAYAPADAVRLAGVVTIEARWHVNSEQPTYDFLIPTSFELELPEGWGEARVEYPPAKLERFAFAEGPLSVFEGTVAILAHFRIPDDVRSGTIPVTAELTYQACDDRQCLPPVTTSTSLDLVIGTGGREVAGFPGVDGPGAGEAGLSVSRLLWILALGLLGGLILNAMPCVLPVLSLKVFGLVQTASESRRRVTASALGTTAGVLISFWALALAAIAARMAGAAVGWGVQFQSPGFVAFLAVVVVLFCLNLWGLFEIRLPGWLASRAGGGAPREGFAGDVATGMFATLMATPCSAPFLGTAVGFALAQPPAVILAVFTAVGTGMALPYLTLAVWPGAARWLPRPGAWMVRMKEVMGFLLAGAAVWLFYVLAAQISAERLAFLQLTLVALALALWLRRSAQREAARRVAVLVAVAGASATLWLAATAPPGRGSSDAAPGGHIAWVEFDRAAALRLAREGTPVFVDVTADWCITCKWNERLVLDTPRMARAFEERGVLPMRADWTNRDQEIGDFLAEHGRYGIPFYILYRPGEEPHLFGELLTHRTVARALRPLPPRTAEAAGSSR